jgi:hypothetical protein
MYPGAHSQGLEIITVVIQDNSKQNATINFAKEYATQYGLTSSPVVIDPNCQTCPFLKIGAGARFPSNVFVDLNAMKILEINPSSLDIQKHLNSVPNRN